MATRTDEEVKFKGGFFPTDKVFTRTVNFRLYAYNYEPGTL
jgi:hypothetical protein